MARRAASVREGIIETAAGQPGTAVKIRFYRSALLRRREHKVPTFGLVSVNTVAHRSADRLIKTLKQLLDGLAFTAHHGGKHGVHVSGDGNAFDVSNVSDGDVSSICQQGRDVRPSVWRGWRVSRQVGYS